MKTVLMFMLCSLLSGSLWAAGSDEATASKEQPSTQAAKPVGGKPEKARPAPSFTPSEKVGADSSVSFPVDI